MIDTNKVKIGDSVFWLDSDNDVIEHTYLGCIGAYCIVSGELMLCQTYSDFPPSRKPLVDHDIEVRIAAIADHNLAYNRYPVCFVYPEYLYATKMEADDESFRIMYEDSE